MGDAISICRFPSFRSQSRYNGSSLSGMPATIRLDVFERLAVIVPIAL
ncbi:hypothetical protein [Caulobacter sp. LjRoot300]